MIQWDEKYATGVESIDKQHRFLFSFLNDYEESINSGKGKQFMENSFYLLEAYAKAHFKFEEKCMHEHHCPLAGKNQAAHKIFLEKVEVFKTRLFQKEEAQIFFEEMHKFLEDWVKGHIIGIDTSLKGCIGKHEG